MHIEAGKYYRTADGKKVGPMKMWSEKAEHKWEDGHPEGSLWRNDGSSDYTYNIVSEWGPVQSSPHVNIDGMLLRDWFAGQAFAASLTNATGLGSMTPDQRAGVFSQLAGVIYEAADAMLAAR